MKLTQGQMLWRRSVKHQAILFRQIQSLTASNDSCYGKAKREAEAEAEALRSDDLQYANNQTYRKSES
jgi:hypothetical protein